MGTPETPCQVQTTTTAGVEQESETPDINQIPNSKSSTNESDPLRWLCAFASSLFLMSSFGFSQSLGPIQSYLQLNQLKEYSSGEIGWITGLDTALALLFGFQVGPLMDHYGPKFLAPVAILLIVSKFFFMAECTEYWQFMLSLGVMGGIGSAVSSSLAITSIGKLFVRRRGLAMGAALAGSSFGGVIFPLILRRALPEIGWRWSSRMMGFIILGLMVIGSICLLPFPRLVTLTAASSEKKSAAINLVAFRSMPFLFITIGLFLFEVAIVGIGALLPTFAVEAGFPFSSGFTLVATLNGCSCLGRLLPGFAGDHIGHFDVILFMVTLTLVFTAVLFPFGTKSVEVLYAFAGLWGFGSGSFLSITPVCVGKTCHAKDYGRYYGTCTAVVSIGALTSIPAGGALLEQVGSIDAASLYLTAVVLGGVCFYVARSLIVGKWIIFRSNI